MASSKSAKPTLFMLGATGYLGSHFLVMLAKKRPDIHVAAYVRAPVEKKEARLKEIHPNLSVVEGSLEDSARIEEQAAKADYVLNAADADHYSSVAATIKGLEKASESRPGNPPLLIHISGISCTSDNSRGEDVPLENLPHYCDIGLKLDMFPETNVHLKVDKHIVAAGTRKDKPIRTIIIYPGWIYGLGAGVQRITLAIRLFVDVFRPTGFAGTWGKGQSKVKNIHVDDCANAILTVFEAALEGKAEEGAEGLYFAVSDERWITQHEKATLMGDIMFKKGVLKKAGSQVLPPDSITGYGEIGWTIFAGNEIVNPQRLKRLGWEAKKSKEVTFEESLVEELDYVFSDTYTVQPGGQSLPNFGADE